MRVFQPRLRPDRAAAGSGLGLSIAERLVMLMGGEVGCESAPGQGSLFWFTIPTVRAMPAAPKDTRAPDTLSGHVLVVEDNAPNRMLIGAYLDEFGLTYDMVESGFDALERLAAKSYDLVLMDIKMPELDGVETTKRARKMQGPAAEVPIVALTAHAMKGDREELSCRRAGRLHLQAHSRTRSVHGDRPLSVAGCRRGATARGRSLRRLYRFSISTPATRIR